MHLDSKNFSSYHSDIWLRDLLTDTNMQEIILADICQAQTCKSAWGLRWAVPMEHFEKSLLISYTPSSWPSMEKDFLLSHPSSYILDIYRLGRHMVYSVKIERRFITIIIMMLACASDELNTHYNCGSAHWQVSTDWQHLSNYSYDQSKYGVEGTFM